VRRGLGRRQEHGEDDDDEDVYESRQKRASGGLGSIDKGAIGQSSAYDSHDDAMAATKCAVLLIGWSEHAWHALCMSCADGMLSLASSRLRCRCRT